jgi:hypothetical protein
MDRPCGQVIHHRLPVSRQRNLAIPALPTAPDPGCQIILEVRGILTEESLALEVMCTLCLRIQLPDERLSRPLRTYRAVLAAHKIQVAAPQQSVVVIWVQKRQSLRPQCALLQAVRDAGYGAVLDTAAPAQPAAGRRLGEGWRVLAAALLSAPLLAPMLLWPLADEGAMHAAMPPA